MMPGRRQSDDIYSFLAATGCVAIIGLLAWGAVGVFVYALYSIVRGA